MARRSKAILCLGAALWAASPALAGDFDLPPVIGGPEESAPIESAPAAAARAYSLSVESRLSRVTAGDGRSTLATRASAHLLGQVPLGEALDLKFNLRARSTQIEGQSWRADQSLRLDVQELALRWQATPALDFALGRVNLRGGVALGFNPTDWFKANSLVTSDSQDPGDRRLERLGTLLVSGTATLGQTHLSFGYRPKVSAKPGSWASDGDVIGLNLDRTNAKEAAFLKISPPTGDNITLTTSLFYEKGAPGLGVEVSGALGNTLVLYGEAFTQKRQSLAGQALADGAGSAAFRLGLGADQGATWRTQVALGGTWALPSALVGERDMALSLEYHYNGAGLSKRQIQTLAAASGADGAAGGALRRYSASQQEPLAREQLFTRFSWNDFAGEADLSVIAFYVPADHSGQMQISTAIPFGDNAQLSLSAARVFGGARSVYGANPSRSTAQIAIKYTF
jgi:hypothetical protein